MTKLDIFAGPCSVDEANVHEIEDIAKLKVNGKNAVTGTRVVGLKSRSSLNLSGKDMGIDYEAYNYNLSLYLNGKSKEEYMTPPSVKLMAELIQKTGLVIASEIMNPLLQLPSFETLKGKMLIWNPSVNQLGWQLFEMGQYAHAHNWKIGIKNGKWVGEESDNLTKETSVEKSWIGLADYALGTRSDVILIHRGFDIPLKQEFRNPPLHHIATRVKKKANAKLYFDPSHSFGPKLRDRIVELTLEAMRMRDGIDYLYDGILIEVGTSKTDTNQHITIPELKDMIYELAKFRTFGSSKEFS